MILSSEALFILQAIIVIALPFVFWKLKIVKNIIPLVVIQILLGVLLGPSILGRFYPQIYKSIFPKESLGALNGLSWLGQILFGFLTGLHLDLNDVIKRGKKYLVISASSLLVPSLVGALIAIAIFSPQFVGANANKFTFALGMAIAAGVTALPVLSAILMELKIIDTEIGKKSLAYAAANDLFLWLSILVLNAWSPSVSTISGSNTNMSIVFKLALAIILLLVSYFLVRPLLKSRLTLNKGKISDYQVVFIVALILLYGFVAEVIGINYLLGGFILGVIFPRALSNNIGKKLNTFVYVLLLPYLFILTGLKTSFDITDSHIWVLAISMTIGISAGNILGVAIPEKLFGSSTRESLEIGILMQTKGLMEVVFLNLLLTQKIISSLTFSAMLFMAMATTSLTKPLLSILKNKTNKKLKL